VTKRKNEEQVLQEVAEEVMDMAEGQAEAEQASDSAEKPSWVIEWENRQQAMREEIANLAVELADAKARVKSLTKLHDSTVEIYGQEKNEGPVEPPPPDPQQELPFENAALERFRAKRLDEVLDESSWINKLAEAGIETAGQLMTIMQSCPGDWFSSIKGIGREKAALIEDAFNPQIPAEVATEEVEPVAA
jgi:hypothetical protein